MNVNMTLKVYYSNFIDKMKEKCNYKLNIILKKDIDDLDDKIISNVNVICYEALPFICLMCYKGIKVQY